MSRKVNNIKKRMRVLDQAIVCNARNTAKVLGRRDEEIRRLNTENQRLTDLLNCEDAVVCVRRSRERRYRPDNWMVSVVVDASWVRSEFLSMSRRSPTNGEDLVRTITHELGHKLQELFNQQVMTGLSGRRG